MIENEYHFKWEDSKEKIREDLVKLHKVGKIVKGRIKEEPWNAVLIRMITKKKWELRKKLIK